MHRITVDSFRRTLGILLLAGVAVLAVSGCRQDGQSPGPPLGPQLHHQPGHGGGPGGGGGGGGGGEDPAAAPGVLLAPLTSDSRASALTGDGRDFDGSATLAAGEGNYQEGRCRVGVSLAVQNAAGPDTLTLAFVTGTGQKGKSKDCAVADLTRTAEIAFPPNGIGLGVERITNVFIHWQADEADQLGQITQARGKINLQDTPACEPLRFNPQRAGFEASSNFRVERVDGGWRVFTDPADNVGQCQDRSGATKGPPQGEVPGETFALDLEFFVDESVGDGAGPGG